MEKYEAQAKRILIFSLLAALTGVLLVLFLKYLFLPLLPFLIALLISIPVTHAAAFLRRKTRLPGKLLCFLLLTVIVAALFTAVWIAAYKLLGEAMKLVSGEDGLVARITGLYEAFVSYIGAHFPKLSAHLPQDFENTVISFVSSQAGRISDLIAAIAFSLPGGIFFAIVTHLAAYYLASDDRMIKNKIASLLDERKTATVRRIFRAVKSSFFCYLRAGGYLMLITFLEVLAGLVVLGVGFPILLSILVSALDFLPVLGTGVVLAPMGIVFLAAGEYYKGVGVLIIWGVTTLVRQIIEPKIVSKNVGIHPLFSLASAYVGLRLFGAVGLIFLPVAVTLTAGVIRELRSGKETDRIV